MSKVSSVAVVTGAASGLGAAVAQALRLRGSEVAMLDLDQERGSARAEELGGVFVPCDVGDPDSVCSALETVRGKLGQERICVNCAGVALARTTLYRGAAHDPALFERVVRINLMGTFNMASQSAAGMATNAPLGPDGDRGVIVNTASMAAFEGQIGHAAYAASKAAIVGMTLPMARDLARYGIRVVTVAPGMFETPMATELPERHRQIIFDSQAFPKRLGKPEEFAAMVLHCIDNPMLNGETLRLDAGCRMPPR